MTFNINKKDRNKIALLLGTIIIISVLIMGNFTSISIVNPGWEVYNQIAGIKYDEHGVKTGPDDFPHPVTIGSSNWIVDEDEMYWGSPTIMIQTSEIRHVDFTGTVVPASQPATAPIIKNINNHQYVVDQHIYMFDITIRTVADKRQHSYFNNDEWEHETSWSKVTDTLKIPEYGGHIGKQFNGGVFTKFVISPWSGSSAQQTPSGYRLDNAWAGIMSSTVALKEQGQIENQWGEKPTPDSQAEMFVRGGLDNGAQINMYEDGGGFGTPAPIITWDSDKVLDPRIRSTVVLYLPAQMYAGAYLTRNWAGVTTQLSPCDVYIKYTVRVDVMQAHDYVLVTNPIPPTLAPPEDYYSWTQGFWDGLLGLFSFNSPYYWLIIVAVVAVILVLIYKLLKSGKSESSGEGGPSKKYFGVKWYHWIVISGLLALSFIPDPTDVLDFGLPIIEPILASIYYIMVRPRKGAGQ